MKIISNLLIVLVLICCSFNVSAALWHFSYTFSSGDYLNGSVTGNLNKDGVTLRNVHNLSLSANGTIFSGSPNLYLDSYKNNTFGGSQNAVFSTSPELNNFIISDSINLASYSWTNIFYIIPMPKANNSFPDGHANCYSLGLSLGQCKGGTDQQFIYSNWHLTQVTLVPTPSGIWLFVSGLMLIMFTQTFINKNFQFALFQSRNKFDPEYP